MRKKILFLVFAVSACMFIAGCKINPKYKNVKVNKEEALNNKQPSNNSIESTEKEDSSMESLDDPQDTKEVNNTGRETKYDILKRNEKELQEEISRLPITKEEFADIKDQKVRELAKRGRDTSEEMLKKYISGIPSVFPIADLDNENVKFVILSEEDTKEFINENKKYFWYMQDGKAFRDGEFTFMNSKGNQMQYTEDKSIVSLLGAGHEVSLLKIQGNKNYSVIAKKFDTDIDLYKLSKDSFDEVPIRSLVRYNGDGTLTFKIVFITNPEGFENGLAINNYITYDGIHDYSRLVRNSSIVLDSDSVFNMPTTLELVDPDADKIKDWELPRNTEDVLKSFLGETSLPENDSKVLELIKICEDILKQIG